jgi:hypothetical protein
MVKAKKAKKPPEPLEQRIVKAMRARELGRRKYAQADRLVSSCRAEMTVGEPIELPNGKKAVLKDNFADRDVVFRPLGVRRYELEITEP